MPTAMRALLHWMILLLAATAAIAAGIGLLASVIAGVALAAAAGVAVAVLTPVRSARNAATMASALLLGLLAVEAILSLTAVPPAETTVRRFDGSLYVTDPGLGWTPRPSTTVRTWRERAGRVIDEATYTIDAHGLRATPGGVGAGETVLFLGDSFMFGEGIDDDDTLPVRFAAETARAFHVVNLGVPGYGPHHVLLQLQTGRVDRVVKGRVRAAFLWVIDDHLARAAGDKKGWLDSPQYEVQDEGIARHIGSKGDAERRRGRTALHISAALREAELARLLWPIVRSPHQINLFEALLRQIREEVARRYGVDLVVLYWTEDHAYGLYRPRVAAAIERAGGTLILVPEVLKQAGLAPAQMLIPGDGHPARPLNDFLAKLLARRYAG
jgi:hypothetical protein